MNRPAQIGGDNMLFLSSIPGVNYAVLAWTFVKTYWRPLLLVGAVVVSFGEGVKWEKKRGDAANARAELAKVKFERDNLKKAADHANTQMAELQKRADENAKRVEELQNHPTVGDCSLSDDALKRLRGIGRPAKRGH
jgi:hypothetical protein